MGYNPDQPGALRNIETFTGTRVTIREITNGATADVTYWLDENHQLIRRHNPAETDPLYARLYGGPYDGLLRPVTGPQVTVPHPDGAVTYRLELRDGQPVYRA